jgi:hypothetical protein
MEIIYYFPPRLNDFFPASGPPSFYSIKSIGEEETGIKRKKPEGQGDGLRFLKETKKGRGCSEYYFQTLNKHDRVKRRLNKNPFTICPD